jgi:hypothetical protein
MTGLFNPFHSNADSQIFSDTESASNVIQANDLHSSKASSQITPTDDGMTVLFNPFHPNADCLIYRDTELASNVTDASDLHFSNIFLPTTHFVRSIAPAIRFQM